MDDNGAAPNDSENESIQLEISIRQKLEQLAPLSESCCIYRVPERLRSLNPNIYTPKVVSIGPLHHGNETLQDMEEHKYRYLNQFLDRTQKNLQSYIKKVRSQEAKLRSFYAERIKFDSDKFVSIILVDSAFIIQLFLNAYFNIPSLGPRMISDIWPDLLLLENQVPFFILENLYDLNAEANEDRTLSFIHLFGHIFRDTLNDIGVDSALYLQKVSSSQVEGKHFIDIVRNLCLPSEPLVDLQKVSSSHFIDIVRNLCLPSEPLVGPSEPPVGGRRNFTAPSITELHRAGVKLRASKTRNLFSIRFDNGMLEIPKLEICDRLENTLRNLVSFEQCHYGNNGIANYLNLLDCLVNTPKDVELLVKSGIVTHALGDNNEVCSLINTLCKGINIDYEFCFAALYEKLDKHCKKPWNHRKASLRQDYLNSPWAIVSILAAGLLIILTIMQTVCSFISL